MKKRIIFTALTFGLIGSVSCQQDLIEKENPVESDFKVVRTLTLDTDAVNTPQSKSEYTPGVGIQMSGNESMALFYGNSSDVKMSKAEVLPQGNRNYKVTHSAIPDAESYKYWFIIPDNPSVVVSGDNTTALQIPSVQFPGANTYDPTCDFIVGKAMENVTPETTSLVADQLKRMAWPFTINVTLPAGEEIIRTATLTFEGEGNAPVGSFEVTHSSDFASAGISKVTASGNTITAVYPEGLQKTGESYPLWFMMKPGKLNGIMKLSVTTDKATYGAEVSLGAGIEVKEMFNKKGSPVELINKTAEETRFAAFTASDLDLTKYSTADGNGNWTFTNCEVYKGVNGRNGIRMNSGAIIQLPQYYGAVIKNIRVYFHPENTNADTEKLGYKDFVNKKQPNFDKDFVGAFSTFEITGLDNAIISAITYELEEFKYWARFLDGTAKNGETELTCVKDPLATPWHMGLGKGRLTVELKDFNFDDGKTLQFGFNPKGNGPDGNPDNSACRLDFNRNADTPLKFSVGGGYTWAEKICQFPAEPMQKISFVCKDDVKNAGKYVMSFEVNGSELASFDKRTDNSSTLKEKRIYFQMGFRGAAQAGQSFTVTSFRYEPYEHVVLK